MDRQIVYPGQIPLETDLLNTNRNTMVALAKLAAAMLGSATIVNGLACVPTSPASLQVSVSPGEMYALAALDATAYSSLAADSTHNILKQGISLDAVTLSCPAPATAGQSVNYLIQATYLDSDSGLVALPYYNASNPAQAWSGPGNTGAQQATVRKGIVNISVKPGVAAPSGTQTTPAADAGYTGLWVVTVANGQSTIAAANISQAANAPILPTDLVHAIQQSAMTVAADTGAANVYAVSYSPAITALADGMVLWFKAKTSNTGASTLNVNGLGAVPLVGGAHSALQGGEIIAAGRCQVVYRADIASWVLIECTGGALQVTPGTQSSHAVTVVQAAGVVGQVRNLKMNVAAASATATLTADEIIVESALGGARYCLANFNKTINLAATGAGGMDTGSPPANGYVALYAIYNPATGGSALLASNATAAAAPNVYGGANMPAGYTASALVSVWPTNAGGQFAAAAQIDRSVYFAPIQVLSTTATVSTPAALNIAAAVPANARTWTATGTTSNVTAGVGSFLTVAANTGQVGQRFISQTSPANGAGINVSLSDVLIQTPQTTYYTNTGSGAIGAVNITQYTF